MNTEQRLWLGDGGRVPQEAEAELEVEIEKAKNAYAQEMVGAPPSGIKRTLFDTAIGPELAVFMRRAEAAYDAIAGPAYAKRDAQWIPGNRPADYSIGLGESELPSSAFDPQTHRPI